jgi:serine/threonine protein kinase
MLCGYLPFEEMENDAYNEVLFRNIVQCNVEYPNEYITPVAKDLLCKILVKDPKKRITIEEIKLHNFYLLGELLYKQTFESMNSYNNDLLLINVNDNDNDNDKDFICDESKKNDIEEIILDENINYDYKILKDDEEGKQMINDDIEKEQNKHKNDNNIYENINSTEINKRDKDNDKNNDAILLNSDKKNEKNDSDNQRIIKSNKKQNIDKKGNNDLKEKINNIITYQNSNIEKTPVKIEITHKKKKCSNTNTNSNKKRIKYNNIHNKSPKKIKSKELLSLKDEHERENHQENSFP